MDHRHSPAQAISRWLVATFFIAAGANHFRDPGFYLPSLPPWLPGPDQIISISGVAEIAGGIGVLLRKLRRPSGWWLVALLIAVFPANVYMAVKDIQPAERHIPEWLLWLRLPIQPLLIAWVWWSTSLPWPPLRRDHSAPRE